MNIISSELIALGCPDIVSILLLWEASQLTIKAVRSWVGTDEKLSEARKKTCSVGGCCGCESQFVEMLV